MGLELGLIDRGRLLNPRLTLARTLLVVKCSSKHPLAVGFDLAAISVSFTTIVYDQMKTVCLYMFWHFDHEMKTVWHQQVLTYLLADSLVIVHAELPVEIYLLEYLPFLILTLCHIVQSLSSIRRNIKGHDRAARPVGCDVEEICLPKVHVQVPCVSLLRCKV